VQGAFPFMASSKNANAAVTRPLYVLVVEDEALVRLVAATHLTDQGFSVTEAASADGVSRPHSSVTACVAESGS